MNGVLNFDNFIMESKNFGLVNEDSLDDFDIDGKIAKERNTVSQEVKFKINTLISKTITKMYKACDKFFAQKGMKMRQYQYSNSDAYKIEYPDLMWGFTYKPENTINFLLVIGEYGHIEGIEKSETWKFLDELANFVESKVKYISARKSYDKNSYDTWQDSLSGIHGSGSLIIRFSTQVKDLK